jgi:transglutaminase-like putative cysteine protease
VRRTAALGLLAALVLAWSWLRLERGTMTLELAFWAVVFGVLPALTPSPRLRVAAVLVAAPLGLRHALDTLRPGEALDRFSEGFYLYYDITLPFDAARQPLMHGLVVLAVLGFTLAVSLAVAHRRPVLAATLLVAGAAWPATLLTSSNTAVRGAIILAAALAVLGGLSGVARLRQVALATTAVVVAAVGLAGLPAVAKGAFLGWETWEPARPEPLTNVRYVWNTSYATLTWPEKKTTVLTIEAPPISRYWRATTLDVFADDVWLEVTAPSRNEPLVDPLLPLEAQRVDKQLSAEVKVEALEDRHLFGASVPVRYDAGDLDVRYQQTGTAMAEDYVPRGASYTAWSYVVRPSPQRLARSAPSYPNALSRYRVVEGRYATPPTPPFGTEGRREEMENLFAVNPGLAPYRPLYDEALRVAGNAPSPYAAVVALETYFHDGNLYTYDQDPFSRQGVLPPLVEFVTETHRGYCQHFASAMALMLRYLGIPARVAAGFTSGSYDQETGSWTVTDHDAHTWVEVWLRGFGWLPFDPTPGRGDLDGAYSAASRNFDVDLVTAAIAAGAGVASNFRIGPAPPEGIGATREAPGRDIPGDVGVAADGADEESLLRLLALVAAGLAAGIALVKLVLRRSRYLTRDPRRVAGACRRELTEYLADQRVDVNGSATFAELGEVVREQAGIDPEQFVAAAQLARYGPLDDSAAAARRARRELRRVVRALRTRLTVWERARGLVSLRSLGLS